MRLSIALLVMALLAPAGLSAKKAASGQRMTPRAAERMANEIRKGIVTLSEYGVFDDISFRIDNYAVTLTGFASRPILKDSAERVAKRVEGVERVVNKIEVLPLSRFDNDIRGRTYVAIYGDSTLSRYNPNRGVPLWVSPARIAAGITNDPPPGNHPIKIIVRNGDILLRGVVDNEGDRNIAGVRANGVAGAFQVKNEIRLASR